MTYKAQRIGKAYVVRWEKPEVRDIDEIIATVSHLRSKLGEQLIYVGIAGTDSSIPGDEARNRMTGMMSSLLDSCSSAHLVVEGKGLKFVTIRCVAAGFLMLQGSKHTHVNDSLRGALVDAKLPSHEVEMTVEEAESVGLSAKL